ncbi:hypothetical protein [Streptomyces sp. HD]|uniref:hypothetical protein n=1 Tax=Streptomyces sp. HD TaxID=3020892 RepID=UPI00232F10B6|nr:hypothetical protein [Streptomyces sp. HD]MDC0767492.1 hypothetical protein [Streptomyces sp. HD]
MSPPAATDRSPEAVTGPFAGRDGEAGIVGGGAAEAPSPVATAPMLPPAATERAPLAVTEPEGVDVGSGAGVGVVVGGVGVGVGPRSA